MNIQMTLKSSIGLVKIIVISSMCNQVMTVPMLYAKRNFSLATLHVLLQGLEQHMFNNNVPSRVTIDKLIVQ